MSVSDRRGNVWFAVFVAASLAGMLSGCGGGYQRGTQCSSDSECAAGRECVQGECDFTVRRDTGSSGAGDEEDATSGDGESDDGCYPFQGACVRNVCEGSDACQTVACELGCEEWEHARGCTCEARSCRSGGDCGGYPCVDGSCRPCDSDDQCDDGETCQSSGKCLAGQPCESDTDCPARRECSSDGECVDRDQCLTDDDCGDQEICFNGQCTYSSECENDSECRDGMECIGGQCYEEVCRGDSDCEGAKICDAGECVQPPSATRCFVATSDGTISNNQRIALEAYALDSNGAGVAAEFDWSSSNPQVAKIGSSEEYAIGGSTSGTATITAELVRSGSACEGRVKLENLGPVSSGDLRVVVTSAKESRPVGGAEVVLGNGTSATTGGSGVATLSRPSNAITLSVFHPDFNYVTIQGLNASDVRIPLTTKSGSGPVAGFTGQFDKSKIHTQGDVTLGLAGSSITGGMLDIGLEELFGTPFIEEIQTPRGRRPIPLPSGLVFYGQVLGFDLDVRKTYYTTTPGGARIGWGLAGEVSGQNLAQLFGGGGFDNPLAALLPLFNRFDHAARPLQLKSRPRVTDSSDIDGDGDTSEKVPDYDSFPTEQLRPSVRQKLVTAVDVSNFPNLPNGTTDFAVLLGGNLHDSSGFVPLGISATTDEDGDGSPDVRNLSMAPPHGAVTGGRFVITALSFNADSLDPQQGGLDLPDHMSAATWSRQSLPTQIGLGTFPNASTGTVDRQARTVQINADAGPVFRLQFVGQERSWELWTSGPAGSMGSYSHTAKVPAVPGGRPDLFAQGSVLVDAIQTGTTLDDLVKATGVGLRRITVVSTGFNRTKLD